MSRGCMPSGAWFCSHQRRAVGARLLTALRRGSTQVVIVQTGFPPASLLSSKPCIQDDETAGCASTFTGLSCRLELVE
eukprot:10605941-Alexandrium_andersonii.AAC.1